MSLVNKLRTYLKPAAMRGIENLDDAEASNAHAKIIKSKPFLNKLYIDFYQQFLNELPSDIANKKAVELGSGGGFFKEILPSALTSDLKKLPGIDLSFSVTEMPFNNNEVDAFMALDLLHHIQKPHLFFQEINRCLKPRGRLVLIEPANTLWGSFIYSNFHHEPFNPKGTWELPEGGPMSIANGALPWIIFNRDRALFESKFPSLHVVKIKTHTPFRYLLSGGLSFPQLLPSPAYPVVHLIEKALSPLSGALGMFMTIVVEKK